MRTRSIISPIFGRHSGRVKNAIRLPMRLAYSLAGIHRRWRSSSGRMPHSSPAVLRRPDMSSETLFLVQLVLGYVSWLLCFSVYLWPWLKARDRFDAQRAIATLHSFRFFGLVFILPGVAGPNLPAGFANFAARGDFATGVL